jgi:NADPH-dependent glutamate synthase beta subunit-like oxidoreductase
MSHPRCIVENASLFIRGHYSLWAIREGRQAAHAIDKFLMGKTDLPR